MNVIIAQYMPIGTERQNNVPKMVVQDRHGKKSGNNRGGMQKQKQQKQQEQIGIRRKAGISRGNAKTINYIIGTRLRRE